MDILYFDWATHASRYMLNKEDVLWATDIIRDKEYEDLVKDVRRLLSRLIESDVDEVVLLPSGETAVNIVSLSIPISVRDKVILVRDDYPGIIIPWLKSMERGLKISYVDAVEGRIKIDEFVKMLDDTVLIKAFSHVHHLTGFKRRIREISMYLEETGGYAYVDATHSIGCIGVNVKKDKPHILSADVDRWLSPVSGIGVLYVKREVQKTMDPPIITSLNTLWERNTITYRVKNGGGGYQAFKLSEISLALLIKSLEELFRYGVDKAENRILTLGGWLIDELVNMGYSVSTPYDRAWRAGIISIETGDADRLKEYLEKEGILVSSLNRYLRIAIHYRHSDSDIERLIDVVKEGGRRLGLLPS